MPRGGAGGKLGPPARHSAAALRAGGLQAVRVSVCVNVWVVDNYCVPHSTGTKTSVCVCVSSCVL